MRLRWRAAMLAWIARMAGEADEEPEPYALDGLSDVCSDMSELAERISRSLDQRSLGRHLADAEGDDDTQEEEG